MYSIGIDIGASHIGAGLLLRPTAASAHAKLEHVASSPLEDKDPNAVVEQIVAMVDTLRQKLAAIDSEGRVEALGVGCPGQIVRGTVVAASNLKWSNVPLQRLLEQRTRLPTRVLNDADAAVCAECWTNPDAGITNAALFTLGSGVGLGLILNGMVYTGAHGLIEGGHMIVNRNGEACGCGQKGCVEAYASASATARRHSTKENKQRTTAKEVFDKLLKKDKSAEQTIDETCEYLALACINICRIIDPEVIFLAGGMAQAGSVLIERVQYYIARHGWTVLPNEVDLRLSTVGEHAGIMGAALAALRDNAVAPSAATQPSSIESAGRMARYAVRIAVSASLMLATSVLIARYRRK